MRQTQVDLDGVVEQSCGIVRSVVDEQPRREARHDTRVPELLGGRQGERVDMGGHHLDDFKVAVRGRVVVPTHGHVDAQVVELISQRERERL